MQPSEHSQISEKYRLLKSARFLALYHVLTGITPMTGYPLWHYFQRPRTAVQIF